METAKVIAFQIAVMFLLIAFGAGLYKWGIITKRANKQISNFVISVVCPVLIFTAYQTEFDISLLKGLLISALIAAVSHLLLFLTANIVIKKKDNPDYNIERFSIGYSNCAFLCIPLIQSVYGDTGVLYLTAYITVFNLLMWTHGVSTMKKSSDFRSFLKALRSPAIISIVLGILCFVTGLRLPEILLKPLNYISSLNTPLAMIVSGITFAQSDLKNAFKKPKIYLIAAFKLLIVPIVILLVLMPFSIDETILNTSVIAAACPTATAAIMFAYKYGGNAVYASEIFALSTIMSAFTLPLILVISSILN